MTFRSFRAGALSLLLATQPAISHALPSSPQNVTVLSVSSTGCNAVGISAHYIRANQTSIDILLDTRNVNSTALGSDSLAWTDSVSSTDTLCHVCATFRWSESLYGRITGIDYDFEHRMDLGLLDQVASYIYKEGTTEEEFYDYLYIYADDSTSKTVPVRAHVANETEGLLLDYTKPFDGFCVRTQFGMYNRVGVTGASGEISKRSIFTQSVNIDWQGTK